MPRRNDLLLNRQVITQISREANRRSLFFLFSSLLGDGQAPEENMIVTDSRGVPSEFIKIRKYKEVCHPARVVDNSQVPNELIAGVNTHITFDRFIGEAGSQALLDDEQTIIMVVDHRNLGDKRFEYTIQLVGQPGDRKAVGDLLRLDAPINYGVGSSVGEASLTSPTMVDDGEKSTDFTNVLQISRAGIPRTGSALADETYMIAVDEDINGNKISGEYPTDLPVKAAYKFFSQIDRMLMYNVPNFSVGDDKKIANRAATSRYPERPTFAGLYWQWDRCPWKWQAYKSAPLSEGVNLLNYIFSFMKNEMGTATKWVAFAQGSGREWLKDVFEEAVKVKSYQITIQVDAAGKLGGGKIGYDIDEYMTRNGSLSIVDIGQAFKGWGEFKTSDYAGVGYRKRSDFIYISPVTVRNGQTVKKPATIYHKQGNGINRGFVMGVSRGITGQMSGMSTEAMLRLQEEGVQRMMSNDKYRIDSTIDADEIHFLSHISVFMDVDQMTRIELLP